MTTLYEKRNYVATTAGAVPRAQLHRHTPDANGFNAGFEGPTIEEAGALVQTIHDALVSYVETNGEYPDHTSGMNPGYMSAAELALALGISITEPSGWELRYRRVPADRNGEIKNRIGAVNFSTYTPKFAYELIWVAT